MKNDEKILLAGVGVIGAILWFKLPEIAARFGANYGKSSVDEATSNAQEAATAAASALSSYIDRAKQEAQSTLAIGASNWGQYGLADQLAWTTPNTGGAFRETSVIFRGYNFGDEIVVR